MLGYGGRGGGCNEGHGAVIVVILVLVVVDLEATILVAVEAALEATVVVAMMGMSGSLRKNPITCFLKNIKHKLNIAQAHAANVKAIPLV